MANCYLNIFNITIWSLGCENQKLTNFCVFHICCIFSNDSHFKRSLREFLYFQTTNAILLKLQYTQQFRSFQILQNCKHGHTKLQKHKLFWYPEYLLVEYCQSENRSNLVFDSIVFIQRKTWSDINNIVNILIKICKIISYC